MYFHKYENDNILQTVQTSLIFQASLRGCVPLHQFPKQGRANKISTQRYASHPPLRSSFCRSFLASRAAAREVGVQGRSSARTGELCVTGSFTFSFGLSLERRLWSVGSTESSLFVFLVAVSPSLSLSSRLFGPYRLSVLRKESFLSGSGATSAKPSPSVRLVSFASPRAYLSLGEVLGEAIFGEVLLSVSSLPCTLLLPILFWAGDNLVTGETTLCGGDAGSPGGLLAGEPGLLGGELILLGR